MKVDSKESIGKLVQNLSKNRASTQLLTGSASGWVAGFMASKLGKPMAIGSGAGIILLQLAHNQGVINFDQLQDRMRPNIQNNTNQLVSRMREFAKTNKVFTAGFIGGFLIGIAT